MQGVTFKQYNPQEILHSLMLDSYVEAFPRSELAQREMVPCELLPVFVHADHNSLTDFKYAIIVAADRGISMNAE